MWKSISQVLADQFGAYYSIKEKNKVHSGEMNEAWIINDGIQAVFVKVNERSYRSMFRAEADQLILLNKTESIRVPQVYGVGCSQNHSFILMEALPITQQTALTSDFGLQLAKLHQLNGTGHYGLDFDTWLGPEYQPNKWSLSWAKFFSEQRIGWQLQLCEDKGLSFGNIEQIVHRSTKKLEKHQPSPALLHGNLWIENTCIAGNQTVTYDPACYWGDRECDLAFSELFQPFPMEFYQSYNQAYPLDQEGYQQRKGLYQLYHLLNFSHRFNGNYIQLTQKYIDKLLNE
ncbi:fructosamine kinase family protein [uncultured Haemophilus sp.]|uniref:fructosamine kinase family protein n=1 Tax=uncultured Haemophilus sp. TaxID=237779 RepID=UPI002805943E|nr:fructosamine kinase family protein [uncultured Haemophilus sp.]